MNVCMDGWMYELMDVWMYDITSNTFVGHMDLLLYGTNFKYSIT